MRIVTFVHDLLIKFLGVLHKASHISLLTDTCNFDISCQLAEVVQGSSHVGSRLKTALTTEKENEQLIKYNYKLQLLRRVAHLFTCIVLKHHTHVAVNVVCV